MNIFIRVDASQNIGLGHLIRMTALAKMLHKEFSISFIIKDTSTTVSKILSDQGLDLINMPAELSQKLEVDFLAKFIKKSDVLILDGYHFLYDYQKLVKPICRKLVCIDDFCNGPFHCDAIINHSAQASSYSYPNDFPTHLMLGNDYVLLRPSFTRDNSHVVSNNVRKIVISMGGSDQFNLSPKFTEALLRLNLEFDISIILGQLNHNYSPKFKNHNCNINYLNALSEEAFAQMLRDCDLLICPGSSVLLEGFSLRTPTLSGYYVENQVAAVREYGKLGACLNIGDFLKISIEEIGNHLLEIVSSAQMRYDQIEVQKKIIDHNSSKRILSYFLDIKNSIS